MTFDRLQDKQRELGINKRKKRKSVAKKHLIRFLRLFAWLWSVNIGFLLISEFLLTYLNLLIQSIIQYFLKKLELYRVTDRNHSWFKNYLSNRKQFIQINNENTELKTIACGVSQGSILGPILFLLYVNDLKYATNLLDPIMYADDTNLFLTHKDISYLFETANLLPERIDLWFISNKLSLNVSKAKYSFFYIPSKRDDILLLLPKSNINNDKIEGSQCLKFLGVLLDENLCWKEHIKYIESKFAKNIGLLYKAKPYTEKHSLLLLYYSYMHSYINYIGKNNQGKTLKNILSTETC